MHAFCGKVSKGSGVLNFYRMEIKVSSNERSYRGTATGISYSLIGVTLDRVLPSLSARSAKFESFPANFERFKDIFL